MEAAIVGAVIAGLFALLAAYLGFLLEKGRKKIASTRRALAVVTPPGSSDLVLLQHSYSIDMESDGSCSIMRRIVLHYQGNQELPTKKFLLHHEGIDFYLKAKGISLEKLNPDAEFKILVRDEASSVRQDAWTYIAGDHNQTLETTIKFDVPLSPQNPEC